MSARLLMPLMGRQSTRYRSPRRWSSRRSASSGLVSRRRWPRNRCATASLRGIGFSGIPHALPNADVPLTQTLPETVLAERYGRPVSGQMVGLFAGIGGIELGLASAGFDTELLCELDPAAQRVLRNRFPGVRLHDDVSTLKSLPSDCSVIAAGFPCQDLSQAGRGAGIDGSRSGLVTEVFRLLDCTDPDWLVLENVPFMLQLDRGQAIRRLTSELGERGFRWAYRVVDARAFGVPQRRRRVLLLASRKHDPRPALFGQDGGTPEVLSPSGRACGFYWTEGNTGLGWAVDAVPTIKGGSGLGIPSPPAIWMPDGALVTPDIRDAERLQGFAADWTRPAVEDGDRDGVRWKLIGNAVCVAMSTWLGARLAEEFHEPDWGPHVELAGRRGWPPAAWGDGSKAYEVAVSEWPLGETRPALEEFLEFPTRPLSERAVRGFRARLRRSSLKYPTEFMEDLESAWPDLVIARS